MPRRHGFGDGRRLTDLILLRDPRMRHPANTRVWLDALQPDRWFHCVEGLAGDAERIARVVTGTAVGLVLSGGGARAYCHIGAVKALQDARVPIDFAGGASMGAVVAAGPALGWDHERLDFEIRRAFVESDPLSDLAVPIIAMSRARKVAGLLQRAYGDIDLADLALPFFAVSSNLTSGRIEVHRSGLMRRAMRASIAIPGVLPPVVIDGQVLVDGAVLKNFPTSVMRQLNSGPIVGVDMSQTRGVDPQALENPPSWWKWILSGAWKSGPAHRLHPDALRHHHQRHRDGTGAHRRRCPGPAPGRRQRHPRLENLRRPRGHRLRRHDRRAGGPALPGSAHPQMSAARPRYRRSARTDSSVAVATALSAIPRLAKAPAVESTWNARAAPNPCAETPTARPRAR